MAGRYRDTLGGMERMCRLFVVIAFAGCSHSSPAPQVANVKATAAPDAGAAQAPGAGCSQDAVTMSCTSHDLHECEEWTAMPDSPAGTKLSDQCATDDGYPDGKACARPDVIGGCTSTVDGNCITHWFKAPFDAAT